MHRPIDTLDRINELRKALGEMKSEDVREAIQAAISDCERRMGIERTDVSERSPRAA